MGWQPEKKPQWDYEELLKRLLRYCETLNVRPLAIVGLEEERKGEGYPTVVTFDDYAEITQKVLEIVLKKGWVKYGLFPGEGGGSKDGR